MIIYQNTKNGFQNDWDDGLVIEAIQSELHQKMNVHPGDREVKSWRSSLSYMRNVVGDSRIPDDAGIAIEFNIPQTGKRVDFMISGHDGEGRGSVIIIELKQWEKLSAVSGKDGIVRTLVGGGLHEVTHPSYQAWSYAALLKDFNETVQTDNVHLKPCAYLHNYTRSNPDPLDAPQYTTYLDEAPAFDSHQRRKLIEFITSGIIRGDQCETLYKIAKGRLRPSKSLQDCIASMVKGNREFTLIDEQKVVYEEILRISKKAQKGRAKEVVIVEGGPGTGKTVLAINLLSELTNRDQVCMYVSKNSAPRSVYRKKLVGHATKSSVDNMFKGSGSFAEAPENFCGTILADEAHRLNLKSGLFRNKGENQIKEIINAARCSVFFIDEAQRVTVFDIGSVREIEYQAKLAGASVTKLTLPSQFRCNGSDGFLAWLDNTLGIRPTANTRLAGFDFRVVDSPDELREMIRKRNRANRARIVAGYCWKWVSSGKDDPDVHDIKIGDFEMSWNLGNTDTWAIDPLSVEQAGCIHTCQGLEFDYVGVIVGPDLRFENGRVVTDVSKRASTDQSVRGIKKMLKENPAKAKKLADEIIRNTYRTLMTRGMKGCFVWCCDPLLNEYLKKQAKARGDLA